MEFKVGQTVTILPFRDCKRNFHFMSDQMEKYCGKTAQIIGKYQWFYLLDISYDSSANNGKGWYWSETCFAEIFKENKKALDIE